MSNVESAAPAARDYASTLFLPRTAFPMKADPKASEPALLERWERTGLLDRVRAAGEGRPRFVVHDGPPYANGDVHFGHALNKALKDMVARSRRMSGWASDLVPGWDCHGLPVEWGVEQAFREAGRAKADVPVPEFRAACRAHADRWLDAQRRQFRRLGVLADWDNPYLTMDFAAEARVAEELLALAASGQLHRGAKPVMWSVVEGTALAEAEVEYKEREDEAAHVAFGVLSGPLAGTLVPAWTTTPWTLPANRAVAHGEGLAYGLYRLGGRPCLVADALAGALAAATGLGLARERDVAASELSWLRLSHPLAGAVPGYEAAVPLFPAPHVTDAAGTGFVHTAPSHGREDHDAWTRLGAELAARGYDASVPHTLAADGRLTEACPGFEGRAVLTPSGGRGDANAAVLDALAAAGTLLARHVHRHEYPHSWRSKKPVVYRTTPQWFVGLDRPVEALAGRTLRDVARENVDATEWLPARARNRMAAMLEARPDWLVSRQRSWGVPLAVFVDRATGALLRDDAIDARVVAAFRAEGADAWFAPGAAARFLGPGRDPAAYEKVDDVLDVWFDSGATHAFVLDDPERFPTLAGLRRAHEGGPDRVMYLEGSDQHRGWFQSSLLVGCANRGRAPYDVVMTHGFVLDAKGAKMSKSTGNVTAPAAVVDRLGADALRLWAAGADPTGDLRVGEDALKGAAETHRKWRNTLRWLLGNLAHRPAGAAEVPHADLPEMERLLLHRLAAVGDEVRAAYDAFDFRRVVAVLTGFMANDLSAFHFEARKDALYCDAASSPTRLAALQALDAAFLRLVAWMAPLVPFAAEEAWLERFPSEDGSVHLQSFPETPEGWRDDALAERWERVLAVRRAVTGALEVERGAKRLRSSLEASPTVHVEDPGLLALLREVDLATACVTSGVALALGAGPPDAFRLPGSPGVAVVPSLAEGRRCARSWKVLPDVGADPSHPDLCERDAAAVRERDGRREAA